MELIGLDSYRQKLLDNIYKGNTSLILNGSPSVGKFSLVMDVLREIVTNDMNIHILKSEEGKHNINVEQVRDLFELINVMPYGDSRHYIVIDNADELNDVSFNLLLKRIEEPKSSEMFILTTSKLSHIADTIKSRCLIINVMIPADIIKAKLELVNEDVIRKVLIKQGFAYIIEYINSDATKAHYTDALKLCNEILNLTSTRKLNQYADKVMADLDFYMNFFMEVNPTDYIVHTFELIKSNTVNKQILVDLMLYHIVESNTKS